MKKNSLNRIKWLILALSAAVLLNVLLLLQFSPRALGPEHPGSNSSVSDASEVSDISNGSNAPNTPDVSGVPDIPNAPDNAAPDNIAAMAGSGGGPGDITAAKQKEA